MSYKYLTERVIKFVTTPASFADAGRHRCNAQLCTVQVSAMCFIVVHYVLVYYVDEQT